MSFQIFNLISVWAIALLTFVISLIAFEVGYLLGGYILRRSGGSIKAPLDSMVAAMMGLLAFILAFTFGLAGNHFDNKRTIVVDEANAVRTTYLRSKYLPEPIRTVIHPLLKDYVSLRVEVAKTGNKGEVIEKSEQIQKKLWDQAVALVETGHESDVYSIFIESLNEVIDLHAKRVQQVFGIRVPDVLWYILYFLMILSMGAMGYLSGFRESRNLSISLLVILSFTSVIYLIADLERSQEGFIRISQKPLIDVINMIEKS